MDRSSGTKKAVSAHHTCPFCGSQNTSPANGVNRRCESCGRTYLPLEAARDKMLSQLKWACNLGSLAVILLMAAFLLDTYPLILVALFLLCCADSFRFSGRKPAEGYTLSQVLTNSDWKQWTRCKKQVVLLNIMFIVVVVMMPTIVNYYRGQ